MLAACRVEDVRPPAFLNQLCSSSTSRRCPATARHSTRRQCDRRRDTKSVSRVSPDDPAAPILSMIVHRRRSETLTLKGICAELKLTRLWHARSSAPRFASRRSTIWRRHTNHVSRGSGRRARPLRKKRARHSAPDSMCS